LSLSGTNSKKI